MLTSIVQSVKSIIAGEMPSWFRFSEPAATIGNESIEYFIRYEHYDAPVGKRQRRVRISISRPLLEHLSDLDDAAALDNGLNDLRRAISRKFERLTPSQRLTEWFIDAYELEDARRGLSRFIRLPL